MKTGKNNRFLAGILAASMMLTMSPFAFAADETEQKEMTAQEQVQSATQNETNANPRCLRRKISLLRIQTPKRLRRKISLLRAQTPKRLRRKVSLLRT